MSAEEYVQPSLPGMPPPPVDLDMTGIDLVRAVATASRAISMWENARDVARAQLIKVITGGDDAEPGTYEASYRGFPAATVTITEEMRFGGVRFREDHPDLYDAYRYPSRRVVVRPARTLPAQGEPDA